MVTGDAVERGKPYPDPYLKAARLLGVEPADCLAIEDSNVGARSAESAGCTVLCVPNHVPILDAPGTAVRRLVGGPHGRKPSGPGLTSRSIVAGSVPRPRPVSVDPGGAKG